MPPCGRPAGADRLSSAWLRCPLPPKKPSQRVSDSQSHAKVRPLAQVAVFCAALRLNLQPALTPLPVRFGRYRYRYRTGFVARHSAEAIVREIALRHPG